MFFDVNARLHKTVLNINFVVFILQTETYKSSSIKQIILKITN